MYTILLDDSNALVTTAKERIMQRSKLVDRMQFLVEREYKGIDMSDFTVAMEYLLPVSRELHSEILTKQDELYKDHLDFRVPFDTCLTKEAGNVEVQLTFVRVGLDEDGQSVQQVRKTSPVAVTVAPISAWSDIVADSALSAIDQRLVQAEAMIGALDDMSQILYDTKADNIHYDEAEQYIQLTANGEPIGDKIRLNLTGSATDVCVKCVEISTDNELFVTYTDGRTESIGKIAGGAGAGIYIPSVSSDGILTMTLSETAGEPSYSWDIDPFNDWTAIGEDEPDAAYIWEKL